MNREPYSLQEGYRTANRSERRPPPRGFRQQRYEKERKHGKRRHKSVRVPGVQDAAKGTQESAGFGNRPAQAQAGQLRLARRCQA